MRCINLFDYEREAQASLPADRYGFLSSGADDEITLANNRCAFAEISLLPRVLQGVTEASTEITLWRHQLSMPCMIAPTAFHGMYHDDAELATARAADEAGVLMTVSTMASTRLEEVRQHVHDAWFQIYPQKDKGVTRELMVRAEAAGYQALVITVDCPILGNREIDKRQNFKLPPDCRAVNLPEGAATLSASTQGSAIAHHSQQNFDRSMTWKTIDEMKTYTDLPIILKGILHPQDAVLAREYGVSAIVVSNHGGRQLDTVPAAIRILPKIAEQLDGQLPIIVDGGIRRGTDIVKALALGADAVMLGRPILWGLAVAGQQGVAHVLSILQQELSLAMMLSGFDSIDAIRECGYEQIITPES